MLITTTAVTTFAVGTELAPALITGALPPTHAALVPTARRKHVLPSTEWGHLSTDGHTTAWDGTAARRLNSLAWLRSTVGATWPQLGDPVPPFTLLANQPAEQWPAILQAWASLQPWRAVPPLWSVSRILTNPAPGAQPRTAGQRGRGGQSPTSGRRE